MKNKLRRSENMATSAAIDKRLAKLEAKTRAKTIETLADYVLFIANRKPGEPWPPVSPEIADIFVGLREKAKTRDHQEV